MIRKVGKFFGYVLISSAIYNVIMTFVNKNAIDQIPDLQTVEFPLIHLLIIYGMIFLLGAILVYFARDRKKDLEKTK
ncbi:MAG: hypothetical protein KKD38_05750 [Candidatus Delongbacteria bacterium]|nr:hypothetical protein [Candidatus Delongbacteria bacterium]MCG2759588.1 hypothetical protein [Candidatus Delongbacteria bacterium]